MRISVSVVSSERHRGQSPHSLKMLLSYGPQRALLATPILARPVIGCIHRLPLYDMVEPRSFACGTVCISCVGSLSTAWRCAAADLLVPGVFHGQLLPRSIGSWSAISFCIDWIWLWCSLESLTVGFSSPKKKIAEIARIPTMDSQSPSGTPVVAGMGGPYAVFTSRVRLCSHHSVASGGILSFRNTTLSGWRANMLNGFVRSSVKPYTGSCFLLLSSRSICCMKLWSLAPRRGSPPDMLSGKVFDHCLSGWSATILVAILPNTDRIVIGLLS